MKTSLGLVLYILCAAASVVSANVITRDKPPDHDEWSYNGTCDEKSNTCTFRKTCPGGRNWCRQKGDKWEKYYFDAKPYTMPCFEGVKERCHRTGNYCNGRGEKYAQTCT